MLVSVSGRMFLNYKNYTADGFPVFLPQTIKKSSRRHIAVFSRIQSWGSGSSQPDHNRWQDVGTYPYSGIKKSQHGLCEHGERSEKDECWKIAGKLMPSSFGTFKE